MEREVFISKPLRGLPNGLISGFMYGCMALLIALALGMKDAMFIPLLLVAVMDLRDGVCGSLLRYPG